MPQVAKLINWHFKCLNPRCKYEFTATTPRKEYNRLAQCVMCKGKRYIKELK